MGSLAKTRNELAAAWHCRAYGPPSTLELGTIGLRDLAAGEVRVRVRATTVTAADSRIRRACFPRGFGCLGRLAFGIHRPRQSVLGAECAGVIEEVGAGVGDWKEGDAVVALAGFPMGCHAEVWTSRKSGILVRKPGNLSFAEAVSIPFGGLTALHFLRAANVAQGTQVLIIGASGAVDVAGVQLCRHLGAVVTAVTSGKNAPLVESLGASRVIDYQRESYATASGEYDCIMDCVGVGTWQRFHGALREGGRYIAVAGGLWEMFPWRSGTKTSLSGVIEESHERLRVIMDWAQTGVLQPVIDQTFPFAALPAAHARADSGRKRGSVVITLDE